MASNNVPTTDVKLTAIVLQNKQTPHQKKSLKNKSYPSIESSTGVILSILCLGKTSVTAIS